MSVEHIWLSSPDMGGDERTFIERAFDDNWIAPLGKNVDEFEIALAARCGVTDAVAVSSGTAAIHLGLQLLGVGPGDLVMVQSLTFAASAFPVLYQGAQPIFIDSEADTWNMSPRALEAALIACREAQCMPKAIIVVDLYGYPANYKELVPLAEYFGVPILEDAAEALGSQYLGKPCGSFGTLGTLSFNGNKIITTSGGGALLTTDASMAQRARYLSTQAKVPAPYYWHSEVGYNYRLSNILAGIGLGQLEVLDDHIAARRTVFDRYVEALNGKSRFSFLGGKEGIFSNRWLTTVSVDGFTMEDVQYVVNRMAASEVEARAVWCPMHLQPVFSDCDFWTENAVCVNSKHRGSEIDESVAGAAFRSGVCLPSGSDLTESNQDRVVSLFLQAVAEVDS